MATQITPIQLFFLGRVFPLPFIVLGLTMTAFQGLSFFRGEQRKSWPTAKGAIEVAEVNSGSVVCYLYTVDGVQYSSDRAIFGELGNRTPSRELQSMRELPAGSDVEVFYNSRNPSMSTLYGATSDGSGFMFTLGSLFLVAGLLLAILLPKALRTLANKTQHHKSDRAGESEA